MSSWERKLLFLKSLCTNIIDKLRTGWYFILQETQGLLCLILHKKRKENFTYLKFLKGKELTFNWCWLYVQHIAIYNFISSPNILCLDSEQVSAVLVIQLSGRTSIQTQNTTVKAVTVFHAILLIFVVLSPFFLAYQIYWKIIHLQFLELTVHWNLERLWETCCVI